MTTTWQPGDTLPHLLIRNAHGFTPDVAWLHDLIEEADDHDDGCLACRPCPGWWWAHESQLGKHDDDRPPLAWLHGGVK